MLTVIVGGQYGSEAKGAATAGVIERISRRTAVYNVRVAGPNAGHTAYDKHGKPWPLRCIPVGAVSARGDVRCILAAGSEIDPVVLLSELTALREAGITVDLTIDGQATVLTQDHRLDEERASLPGRIGSTGKGIGAARAARLLRQAQTYQQWWDSLMEPARELYPRPVNDLHKLLQAVAESPRDHVVIEGTQGYGLGLHAGHYPQCTSSDCRAVDFMSMAGVTPVPWMDWDILVCMRVYPIRVAGNSGPMLNETTWEELGLPVELTTVTKKPRRVGLWDAGLAQDAMRANPGGTVYLSMLDQLPGAVDNAGRITELGWQFVNRVERDTHAVVSVVGTGPTVADQIVI